ncbi:MAG: tRNA lysidine(34) synthetase TilS [Pyrinomonadaceae bacterium]|nr:tRNA lysidine(34) synthetase TilS [Sphingobacteriaceae bacterium]
MLPLRKFLSFIEQNQLFKPNEKVLLAVSGGKDSVLMAHLFNEAKFAFGIAHCNFGLRNAESEGDEQFTQALATTLGVPFFTRKFATDTFAKDHKVSIQMAARELRYEWFEELRQTFEYDYIALAHHQNDTVETVLLNLTRGTGIAGLHGILPKRGVLIRPLLFLNRQEIDQIISKDDLPYREDSSNSSTKYARNKIRHEVIPALKEINPFLEETFASNSQRFKDLEDFLDAQTLLLRAKLFVPAQSGDIHISIDDLKQLNPKSLLLYELFKPYTFSEAVLNDLSSSWHRQSGKLFRSATHSLLVNRNMLILSKNIRQENPTILVNEDNESVTWADFIFKLNISDHTLETPPNVDTAYFDKALLHFPLKLRHWSAGDYFYPFGMKGKKKLSDFFTTHKIPLTDKDKIPVLENGNGDILWVAGYRSDERYKVSPQTKKVIIFEKYKIDEH